MKSQYVPVSCDFHDDLEALSVLRKSIHLEYSDENDQPQEAIGRIEDVWTEKGSEFLRLTSGLKLRLDQIRKIKELDIKARHEEVL